MEGMRMDKRTETTKTIGTLPRRRVIAVGKRPAGAGRWQVRTSLWRYLCATAISQ
jgi:hypothetical protein